MSALSMFADELDAQCLINRLNSDPEIAFIVPDGAFDPDQIQLDHLIALMGNQRSSVSPTPFTYPSAGYGQRWKAVRTVGSLKEGMHRLWHIPTGPLPLFKKGGSTEVIRDPFQGWTEVRTDSPPSIPNFGRRHPAEIRLELRARHHPYSETERESLRVRVSYWTGNHDILVPTRIAWLGDRSRSVVIPAKRWWRRFEEWVSENAFRICAFPSRSNAPSMPDVSFWAFPSAREKLKSGMRYAADCWDLTEGIRNLPDTK